MSFLEESWEEREEKVYREIFGDTGPGIFPLSSEVFARMNAKSIDPRWLTHGVFKCPPTESRSTWAYVTSGMSNPWEAEEKEDYSGLGVEFVLETVSEETWGVEVLQTLMAYNLLLAIGHMGDFPPLDYGDRVPLALSESIEAMMMTYPVSFPTSFSIKSGNVELLQVVGITASELEVAKQTSTEDLKNRLVSSMGNLVTSRVRASVV